METVIRENTEKNKGTNRLRVITGTVYVIVWILLCALKWCLPHTMFNERQIYWGSLGFDLVFFGVSLLGCLEFLRAIDKANPEGRKISTPQRAFTIAFCSVCVPLYLIVEITMHAGFLAVACAFAIYVMFLAATSVFDHSKSTVKGTICCVFCMLYCGVLSVLLSSINHLPENSMVAVLVLFMCTALTDTGAFVIGGTLKRWLPAKLAPQLSPNKTVIGAIGGIAGGIIGAIMAYYLMYICGGVNDAQYFFRFNEVFLTFTSERIHPVVSFVLVGLFTSVLAQVGDLFESAVKRECGIKDMGKLLPGHGGVLDRFDSMLYCSVVVLFCFGVVI